MTAEGLGGSSIEGDVLRTTYRGCDVEVRLAPVQGRWRPVEVSVTSEGGVGAEVIRTLPMRRIEAIANRGEVRWALATATAMAIEEGRGVRLRLSIPKGSGRKPDSFYRRVAAAYEHLAQTTHAPAAYLAEINDVPLTTVHRWVKEARAREILGPGERGRAT